MGGNAWSHRDLSDAGNHFKGKEEDLKHTQKHVNVLSATTTSKKPRVWMIHCKKKLVPRGQQNRLHLNEVTQKGEQNRVLRSTKSTSPKKHTARNKLIPRSQQNRLHQRRLPKRSINVSQGHRNRPHQKKNTAKNKFASRSSKSTSPTKAPTKGKK